MMTCSYGGWDGACPFPKLCDGTGCVECPSGNHVCASGMGYYYRTCPAGKKCDSTGCVDGEDPDNPYLCPADPPPACPPPLPPPPARPPLPPRELWDCHGVMTCRDEDPYTACNYPYVCGRSELVDGCYKCPPGHHICERDRGYYFASCQFGSKCHSSGCKPAEDDPDNPYPCPDAAPPACPPPLPPRDFDSDGVPDPNPCAYARIDKVHRAQPPPFPHRTLSASPVPARTRRRAALLTPVRAARRTRTSSLRTAVPPTSAGAMASTTASSRRRA